MSPSSLSTFGLPISVVIKLLKNDFVNDVDINGFSVEDLSKATGLKEADCIQVIALTTGTSYIHKCTPVSVLQMIEMDLDISHIVTFSASLDKLLNGGIPLRAITEISGTPGIGKTQLCMQVCVSVQLPSYVGGVGGEAVYIDTEGTFTAMRLLDMARHAADHTNAIASSDAGERLSHETLLKGIHYFRCYSCIELISVIRNLKQFIQRHPAVKIIVVDSVAFHFRHNFPDIMSRTAMLYSLVSDLIQLATGHNLAILLTNQMTVKLEDNDSSQLVTCFGDNWAHCPSLRLCLQWLGQVRTATLLKAPFAFSGAVQFQVTDGGIRDLPTSQTNFPSTKKRKLGDD